MGISGSSHVKVFGNCYDLKDGKEYSGFENWGSTLSGIICLIVTIVLIISNFATSFKNVFLIGSLIFSALLFLYLYFLHPNLSKWTFAKNNGTKVDCPKPKPECDSVYKQFLIDAKTKIEYTPYSCDERLKYR